jgi:heme-binding NEAT domain protein
MAAGSPFSRPRFRFSSAEYASESEAFFANPNADPERALDDFTPPDSPRMQRKTNDPPVRNPTNKDKRQNLEVPFMVV